jgi:cytochrome c peroxidase
MIKAAFQTQWWDSNVLFSLDGAGTPVPAGFGTPDSTNEYTLAEINFSLFWGLAIQLYEQTLISDDSPFDHFLKGIKDPAFGSLEQQGFKVFNNGNGRCNQCHGGTLFTNATVDSINSVGRSQSGVLRDETLAFFDTGFRNIGLRPTAEDLGVGAATPFNTPLDFSIVDHPNDRIAVDGAFKIPGLRNTALTGPFFHAGGKGTLDDVAEFYHRRGDFRDQNRANIDREFELVNLGGSEQRAVVAFLKNGLVDGRVRNESAPFDHPELYVPNGALTNGRDNLVRLPPIGANGRSAEGLKPLQPFLN